MKTVRGPRRKNRLEKRLPEAMRIIVVAVDCAPRHGARTGIAHSIRDERGLSASNRGGNDRHVRARPSPVREREESLDQVLTSDEVLRLSGNSKTRAANCSLESVR